MWKRTLVAVAVGTSSLPSPAAEPAANTAPQPTDGRRRDSNPTNLDAIKVDLVVRSSRNHASIGDA